MADVGEREHDLKVWPQFWDDLANGWKTFELRKHDRDYCAGDTLVLREWDPGTQDYTGRVIRREVTYVLTEDACVFMDLDGHCILGLAAAPDREGGEVMRTSELAEARYQELKSLRDWLDGYRGTVPWGVHDSFDQIRGRITECMEECRREWNLAPEASCMAASPLFAGNAERLKAAAAALVEKLDATVNSPEWCGMFALSAEHGVLWAGPTFGEELKSLRDALAAPQHDGRRDELVEGDYPRSRDYRRLWDLIQTRRIVCWVDYRTGAEAREPRIRDVAEARLSHGVAQIGARGICYVYADRGMDDFLRQCERDTVEFIDPDRILAERPHDTADNVCGDCDAVLPGEPHGANCASVRTS